MLDLGFIQFFCGPLLHSTRMVHNLTTSVSQKYQPLCWTEDSRIQQSILQHHLVLVVNMKKSFSKPWKTPSIAFGACSMLGQTLTTDLLLPQGWECAQPHIKGKGDGQRNKWEITLTIEAPIQYHLYCQQKAMRHSTVVLGGSVLPQT